MSADAGGAQVDLVLGPLPDTEWLLHMPARPYDREWTSSQEGYEAEQMRAYAEQAVAAERARCANVVRYWLAGYVPEAGTNEARCVAHVLDGRPAPEGPNGLVTWAQGPAQESDK